MATADPRLDPTPVVRLAQNDRAKHVYQSGLTSPMHRVGYILRREMPGYRSYWMRNRHDGRR